MEKNICESFTVDGVKLRSICDRYFEAFNCNEEIVYNPPSLFASCVGVLVNCSDGNGYCKLEEIHDYAFPPQRLEEPIEVIYEEICTVLNCTGAYEKANLFHRHIEPLGRYKFWTPQTRNSRKWIIAAVAYPPETTIVREPNEQRGTKRVSETSGISCKRKLFE